jgi:hypothetical protein
METVSKILVEAYSTSARIIWQFPDGDLAYYKVFAEFYSN